MRSGFSPVLVLRAAFAMLASAEKYYVSEKGADSKDCRPVGNHIAATYDGRREAHRKAAAEECCQDAAGYLIDQGKKVDGHVLRVAPTCGGTDGTGKSFMSYPAGCFIASGETFYNNNAAGSAEPNTYIICGAKGFQDPDSGAGGESKNDPHMYVSGGGQFDMRGVEGAYFVMYTSPNVHINAMTKERTFMKKGRQIVHGTFFTRVIFKVKVNDSFFNQYMTTLYVAVFAEQPGSFRLFINDDITGLYANRTRLELPDVSFAVTPKNELAMRAHGLEARVKWGQLRMPLNMAGQPVPKNDQSRWYFDTSFHVSNGTVPIVAPHGLVGQSFDGAKVTVHGKRDNYGRGRVFKTSAQGEGAIEGVYTDYIVADAFASAFKFARFGVHTPVAPRNVGALTGFKEPKKSDVTIGSTEDDLID